MMEQQIHHLRQLIFSLLQDGANDVHVGDMDGDGDLDIVSASTDDDTIRWYENNGAADPTWAAATMQQVQTIQLGIHLADMDSDGDLDIVSASQSMTVLLLGMKIMEQQIHHGQRLILQLLQMEKIM